MLKKIALLFCFLSFTVSIAPAIADSDYATTYELAKNGDTKAQFALAKMFWEGNGVNKDDKQATYWCKKVAEQGNVQAQKLLGWIFYRTNKFNNYTQAILWWKKAAKQGDVEAKYNLGILHSDNMVPIFSYKKAFYWYQEAAEQGHAGAQNNLGVMYSSGKGVKQNTSKAIQYFRLACDNGSQTACENL